MSIDSHIIGRVRTAWGLYQVRQAWSFALISGMFWTTTVLGSLSAEDLCVPPTVVFAVRGSTDLVKHEGTNEGFWGLSDGYVMLG
jgi:hypothetical protein